MPPILTIGTPAYKSAHLIGETLESIRAQTFEDYRVIISIDGGDQETTATCRPFLDDPRFELVVHQDQKGWAGNLNWLFDNADTTYFQYWQHDDLAEPNYLERLVTTAEKNPQASVVFSDLKQFGEKDGTLFEESLAGPSPLDRVKQQILMRYWVSIRGLTRVTALRKMGPLRIRPFKSLQEGTIWVAKAAREGEVLRVPETLYYKRMHGSSISASWTRYLERSERCQVWAEIGAGFLEALWPLLKTQEEKFDALVFVVARLVNPKLYRFYKVDLTDDQELSTFIEQVLKASALYGPMAINDTPWLSNGELLASIHQAVQDMNNAA